MAAICCDLFKLPCRGACHSTATMELKSMLKASCADVPAKRDSVSSRQIPTLLAVADKEHKRHAQQPEHTHGSRDSGRGCHQEQGSLVPSQPECAKHAGIGYCCMGCERICSGTCSFCCNLRCCPKDRPSPIFLTYTFLVNAPLGILALVLGITSFTKSVADRPGCDWFIHPGAWLLISAALSAFYILFALRVYRTFSRTTRPDVETGATHEQCGPAATTVGKSSDRLCIEQHSACICAILHNRLDQQLAQSALSAAISAMRVRRQTRRTFIDKLYYTACHDVGTFLYFFAAPFTAVWSLLGLTRDGLEGCEDSEWGIRLVAGILLCYLIFTIFIAMVSCCWEINRLANALVDDGQQQQAGPSVLTGQATQAHQHHGPAAAKFMHHMFTPGFEHESAKPAMAPPGAYSQGPPVASMIAPPPRGVGTHPIAAQPDVKVVQSGQASTNAQPAPYKQDIFQQMAAAYKS